MSVPNSESLSLLRMGLIPSIDGHACFGVVPSEVHVATPDLNLPLMPCTGVVGAIDDFDIKDVLALKAEKALPSAKIRVGISENFEVAASKPVLAEGAVKNFEVSAIEFGDLSGSEVIDPAEVRKGSFPRLRQRDLVIRPFRRACFIEFRMNQPACGQRKQRQGAGKKSHRRISFVWFWNTAKGAGNWCVVQALVVCKNAHRGRAYLQKPPIPSLSNLGRVGRSCAARPAFFGGG